MALIGIGAHLHLRIQRRRINADLNIKRRHLRDESNPFELSNFEFIRLFRLDKDTCRYLINRLDGHLPTSRSDALTIEVKVCYFE